MQKCGQLTFLNGKRCEQPGQHSKNRISLLEELGSFTHLAWSRILSLFKFLCCPMALITSRNCWDTCMGSLPLFMWSLKQYAGLWQASTAAPSLPTVVQTMPLHKHSSVKCQRMRALIHYSQTCVPCSPRGSGLPMGVGRRELLPPRVWVAITGIQISVQL